MDTRKQLLATLTGLALGFSTAIPGHTAVNSSAASQTCSAGQKDEECACEAALKANTIEALEAFLHRYPPGRSKSTACTALALSALSQFISPQNDNVTKAPPGPVAGGPYP